MLIGNFSVLLCPHHNQVLQELLSQLLSQARRRLSCKTWAKVLPSMCIVFSMVLSMR